MAIVSLFTFIHKPWKKLKLTFNSCFREEDPFSHPLTVDQLVAVLRLATSFQMTRVLAQAQIKLHSLTIDPIRKIAIWDEFHLDPELLLPAYAALTQRSEPLTLTMTMSLGIRNFTKIAMCRDLYRQRVGCCGCRKSLSREESQKVAEDIVRLVFFEGKKSEMRASNVTNKPLLWCQECPHPLFRSFSFLDLFCLCEAHHLHLRFVSLCVNELLHSFQLYACLFLAHLLVHR